MGDLTLATVIAFWIGIGFACGVIAAGDEQEPTKWFVLGLFFNLGALGFLLIKRFMRRRQFNK